MPDWSPTAMTPDHGAATASTALLSGLEPEFRFLCLAVSCALGQGDRPALRAAARAVHDWERVLQGAHKHRVAALVADGLRDSADGHGVPDAVGVRMRQMAAIASRRCLIQMKEVLRLSRLFAKADIRVIVLKGVVLSWQLYGDPTKRGPGDIDLLVDPSDFWRAQDALVQAGYNADGPPIPSGAQGRFLRIVRDVTYRNAPHRVELHQRLTANPSLIPDDFNTLWEARGEVALGGALVATLPRAMLARYLCAHGAQHCWDRLCWIADMAAIAKSGEGGLGNFLRPDEHALIPATELVMTLCREWLGSSEHGWATKPPPWLWRPSVFVARFFAGDRWLASPESGDPGWWRTELWRRGYRYSFKADWRHCWGELRADLVYPIDWDVFQLPARLSWLYPALRPVGWLLRNVISPRTRKHLH
jgi:hypothetical protein